MALNGNNFLSAGVKTIFGLDGTANFPVLGLVLAFNLGLLLEFVLLFIFFYKKVGNFGIKNIFASFLKILIATIIMASISFFAYENTKPFFPGNFWGVLVQFILITVISALAYLVITIILKSPEIKFLKRYLPHRNS
ncbi:MAG: hypothetical protein WC520_00495 [Candidatus Paceibacterota bacterium]